MYLEAYRTKIQNGQKKGTCVFRRKWTIFLKKKLIFKEYTICIAQKFRMVKITCHRCRWYRWYTLTCEYLREFSKKIRKEPNVIFSGLGERWFTRKKPEAKNLVTLSLQPVARTGAGGWGPAAGVHHAYYSAAIIVGRKLGYPPHLTMKY